MSAFWSLYITVLTLGTLAAMGWLLWANRSRPSDPDDTPPEFDGITEQNNPPPRWWPWLFIATLVFAVAYLLLYPGLGNWRGLLPGYTWLDPHTQTAFADGRQGWSGVHQWEKEQAQARQAYAPLYARFADLPVDAVAADPQALAMGKRLYASNCALCHGADGQGAPGFPNLADDLWRWGGDDAALQTSIRLGRTGVMPPWAAVLGEQGSRDMAAYVLQLNGRTVPEGIIANPAEGAKRYAQACVACHGAEGHGNPLLGAPDLTQARGFINGASFEAVYRSIHDGRMGQMPAQGQIVGDERVKVLAAYIRSLSQPPAAEQPAP